MNCEGGRMCLVEIYMLVGVSIWKIHAIKNVWKNTTIYSIEKNVRGKIMPY